MDINISQQPNPAKRVRDAMAKLQERLEAEQWPCNNGPGVGSREDGTVVLRCFLPHAIERELPREIDDIPIEWIIGPVIDAIQYDLEAR